MLLPVVETSLSPGGRAKGTRTRPNVTVVPGAIVRTALPPVGMVNVPDGKVIASPTISAFGNAIVELAGSASVPPPGLMVTPIPLPTGLKLVDLPGPPATEVTTPCSVRLMAAVPETKFIVPALSSVTVPFAAMVTGVPALKGRRTPAASV